ncbi:membrane-associated protein, putative, partial [Bodo saltans]
MSTFLVLRTILVVMAIVHCSCRIAPSRFVTTLSPGGSIGGVDIAADWTVIVASYLCTINTILGNVTSIIVAGAVSVCTFADGIGRDARFNVPIGIARDTKRNILYIADEYNYAVRVLNLLTFAVTTLFGSTFGYNNGLFPVVQLKYCIDVVYSKSEILYVVDFGNGVVRRANLNTSLVATVSAPLIGPYFAVLSKVLNDDDTALYIGDWYNYRLRRLQLSSLRVTTVAGTGAASSIDGPLLSSTFAGFCQAKWHCNRLSSICGVVAAEISPVSPGNVRWIPLSGGMTQSCSTSIVPTSTRTPSIPWTATMSFTSTPLHTSSHTIQTISLKKTLTPSFSISARTADATESCSREASASPSSSHTNTATLTLTRWLSASTTLSLSKTAANTQHSGSATPTALRTATNMLQPTTSMSLSSSINLTLSSSSTMEATATKSPPTRTKSSTTFDCNALAWEATSVALVQVNTSDVTRESSFPHNSTFFPLMGSTTNESYATRQDQNPREATPLVFLTSQDVDRLTLLQAPSLLFNFTLTSPYQLVYYYVGNVTTVHGTNVSATWSVHPRSGCVAWCFSGGSVEWLGRGRRLSRAAVHRAEFAGSVDVRRRRAMLTVVLTVPAPGVPRVLASEVRRATQAALIVALLATGALSGSALGRIVATDSMVLCDADAAGGGGVIDFDLSICVESPELLDSRSAIVSNFAVVAAVCVLLLLMATLWFAVTNRNSSSSQGFAYTATNVFLLPSSLLPVLTAVMPSTTVSTTFLAARVRLSPCVGVDALLIALGLLLIVAPLGALACLTVKGSACWTCVASPQSVRGIDNSLELRKLKSFLQRATQRLWKWRATLGSAESLRPAWVVLLEYRVLWYAAVDAMFLVAVSSLAVVGGLDVTNEALCRGCSAAVVVLLGAQVGV